MSFSSDSISAGEPDSYRYGGVVLANGTPAQAGSQVFPGFRPSNEVDESRTAVGIYLDLEANLTEKLLGSPYFSTERFNDDAFFGAFRDLVSFIAAECHKTPAAGP